MTATLVTFTGGKARALVCTSVGDTSLLESMLSLGDGNSTVLMASSASFLLTISRAVDVGFLLIALNIVVLPFFFAQAVTKDRVILWGGWEGGKGDLVCFESNVTWLETFTLSNQFSLPRVDNIMINALLFFFF